MNRQQKLDLVMDLFVHDDIGYAEQVYREGKDGKEGATAFYRVTTGECTHTPRHEKKRQCSDYVEVPFTRKHLAEHLSGKKTYGPYQVSRDSRIKWVCFDVDAYNDVPMDDIHKQVKQIARKVHKLFGANHCLVEHSGSKGYHVWVFFSAEVELSKAFAFAHQLVQTIPPLTDINIEIYPKQQVAKVYGNTVKIPLGIHQKTKQRCLFVNGVFEPHEDQWAVLAEVKKVPASWVEENVVVDTREHSTTTEYVRYTPSCFEDIMRDGADEGLRDESAFRLASYLHSKGLPDDLALGVLEQWNKKNHPPLDPIDLDLKATQGFSGQYGWRPCHLPTFDKHCHSSCPFFQKKVERRWFTNNTSPIGTISRD